MDVQHLEYDDESLVRAALQAAYPAERPVFSQRRGAQIVHAAAARELERGDRRHPFVGGRIAAFVAAAFVLVAGTAGAASAALPGEPLYPIKHVVERAMVAIAGDELEAARLELRFAERRLREASAIGAAGDGTADPAASRRFRAHLDAASSLAGDEVAGEVEQLERSGVAEPTGREHAPPPPSHEPSTQVVPQEQPGPASSGPAEAVMTPSPSPSPSAEPTPDPTPTPLPAADPSPEPSRGVEAQPGDGQPGGGATPSPSPAAPADVPDGLDEPPVRADTPSG